MTQTFLRPVNGDVVLLVDATTGNETPSLPAGFAAQRRYTIRRADASANTVVVSVPSGGSIDGVTDATASITARGEVMFTALDANAWLSNLPSVSGSNITDGTVEYADLSAAAKTAAAAAGVAAGVGSFGQLWATPAASTTLTGTLAAWTVTAVDCTAGAGAWTLPPAASVAAGTAFTAKKADTSANALVISRAGSDLIFGTGSGATTKTLTLAGEAVEFVSNGVDRWTVRASDTPSAVLSGTYGQLWATPAVSTTLTGTLAAWTVAAVDCTAGAGARTLPPANSVGAGVAVCAKKADTSTNALVVSRAGSDLIYGTGSGATSKTLTLAGEAVEFVSNGVDKWTIRASDTPSGVLATTYAGIIDRRLSNRFVFFGDSITIGSDTFGGTDTSQGECFAVYAAMLSGQQIQKIGNAGIAGNTSAQMLARFDTDVTPLAPGSVFLLAGTNDTGTGVPLATFQSNIRAIVAKIRLIGAQPALGTIPPNSTGSPTNRRQLIIQFNHWLRIYAAQQKIPLVDFYGLLADPTNGNWLSAYPTGDGTHPGSAAAAAMGSLVSTTLASRLAPVTVQVCRDDIDENNLLLKGCFGGYSGVSLPTGYTDNAGTPTGHTLSYTTDSLVPGQMLTDTQVAGVLRELNAGWNIGADTLSASASAGAATVSLATINPSRGVLYLGSGATAEVCRVASVSGSGPYVATLVHATVYAHASGEALVVNALPGDTIACSGVYTSDGGAAFSVKIAYSSGSFFPISSMAAAVTRATWYSEGVVPNGVTTISFRPKYAAGTSVISFGQAGVYNLTRGGVLL